MWGLHSLLPSEAPLLPSCCSDPWVTKMLTPLWLLPYHIIPFWEAVTPCPSCIVKEVSWSSLQKALGA